MPLVDSGPAKPRRAHAAALPVLDDGVISLGPWPEETAADDARTLARLYAEAPAMRYWSTGPWPAGDLARAEACLDDIETGARRGTMLRFAARRRESSALVGWVTLFRIEPPRPRTEIGYLLDPALWGQGFGRRMAALGLGYGLERLGASRVEAEVHPGNVASCRVLESLGFQREGPLRERWRTRTEALPMALYVFLAAASRMPPYS
jgi:RimJ/RimL family protein N-acetyltransferase